jgi:hypothetical protein
MYTLIILLIQALAALVGENAGEIGGMICDLFGNKFILH